MAKDKNLKHAFRKGLLYYFMATLFEAILFFCYIWGDAIVPMMDFVGWLFFVTSCLSHAALLLLALLLVFFLPWCLLRLHRLAAILFVGSVSLLAMVTFVNMQVYRIYRFHINGFILNMLTGPGAGDIFDFDAKLYVEESFFFLLLVALCIALWLLAGRMAPKTRGRHLAAAAVLTVVSAIVANGCYIYGSFYVRPAIVKSARLVPYYFPLSASGFLEDHGFERNVPDFAEGMEGGSDICYPLHALQTDNTCPRPDILLILIDSWSRLALTEECMPNLYRLALSEQWYQNHVSSSNGTRYAVFSMFSGVQPYYYSAFETNRISPLFIERLLALDYDIRIYPSASLEDPPFHRMLFQHVPNLRINTPGASSFERDQRIKADLIADLPQLKAGRRPFFAFIFFDLLHAYSLPKELLNRFQPSWEYGDFARLNNDMDPTPFWNLYRNSAFQTDKMVGEIIDEMHRLGLYDSTLLLLTGDHAQEYNENHKNYWGHNSNFTQYQIGVPLIVHEPAGNLSDSSRNMPATPRQYRHRTTHYDLVPTLMHDYLGVTSPVSDYAAGRLLSDTTPRLWHFVGNELRYAFLVEGDTILTKEGAGYIEVTDAHLNTVTDYHINPKAFGQAVKDLNRFMK
jgi:hypothetical protein